MAKDIICRNQLRITISAFPILLLLFTVIMLVMTQSAFSYTIETKWWWNPHKINDDFEITDTVVSKDHQFHQLLVDNAVGEWRKSFEMFVFSKIQNGQIVDVQLYPLSPQDEPKAVLKAPLTVVAGSTVVLDGSESIGDRLEITQIIGPKVNLTDIGHFKYQFVAPPGTMSYFLGFQAVVYKDNQQSIPPASAVMSVLVG